VAFGRFEVSGEQKRLGRMASTPVALAGTKSVNNSPLVGRVRCALRCERGQPQL